MNLFSHKAPKTEPNKDVIIPHEQEYTNEGGEYLDDAIRMEDVQLPLQEADETSIIEEN